MCVKTFISARGAKIWCLIEGAIIKMPWRSWRISNSRSPVLYFQVPTPLPPNRRRFLAIKWLITAAREQQKTNKNARMYKKLAKELLNAYQNEVRTDLFFPDNGLAILWSTV